MKRLLLVALVLTSTSAFAYEQELRAVATLLNERLAGASRRQVAVVDFTDLQGSTTELGRFLAEELSVLLATQSKGYVVIDRTHLKAILQEHKLAASGIIDPQTARQLGKIAGVDALVTGTVTPFGDSVRLSVKALDTQTAAMLAATTADVPKTKAVEELLARSVGGPGLAQPLSAPSSAPRRASGAQRVSGRGLSFELEECRGGGPVTCELFVTATSRDVNLELTCCPGGVSLGRAFDGDGNQLRLNRLMVGNQDGRGRLIANVRTRLTATFSDDSRQATAATRGMLALVEFALNADTQFVVQFRNVALK